MGKRLEVVREWLTPRRRFWVGMGLFAIMLIIPMVRPGTNMVFLLAPAMMLLLSAFNVWPYTRR